MVRTRAPKSTWSLYAILLIVLASGSGGYYHLSAAPVVPTTTSTDGTAIGRRTATASVTIATSIGSCDYIDLDGWADGSILIPTSVTAVAYYGCDTATGTYAVINDGGATPAAAGYSCTAGQWYEFPSSVFPFRYIKILTTGANGTAKIVVKT